MIQVGRKLFDFQSKQDWLNNGNKRYSEAKLPLLETIAMDAKGRIATKGREFRIAEEERTYPVSVYISDPRSIYNYTDAELIAMMQEAVDIWRKKGDRHYKGNSDERIFEIYFDNALEDVIQSLNIRPEDVMDMEQRIGDLF